MELARGAKPGELVDDVRVDEIVEQVASRARARAPDGVTLDVATEPTLVRGEPERIQRAISNLVDNALKWSPQGGRVEIELAGGGLSVRDHGPGFAEGDLPHVFERFYRADTARACRAPASASRSCARRRRRTAARWRRPTRPAAARCSGCRSARRSGHRLEPLPTLLDRRADLPGELGLFSL